MLIFAETNFSESVYHLLVDDCSKCKFYFFTVLAKLQIFFSMILLTKYLIFKF